MRVNYMSVLHQWPETGFYSSTLSTRPVALCEDKFLLGHLIACATSAAAYGGPDL